MKGSCRWEVVELGAGCCRESFEFQPRLARTAAAEIAVPEPAELHGLALSWSYLYMPVDSQPGHQSAGADRTPTRWTLVGRLKSGDDRQAWEEFYRTYGRVITGLAMRAGLEPEEAEDALQETVLAMCRNLPEFKADPAAGSFKSWLLQMAKWRILNQLNKRPRGVVHRRKSGSAGAEFTGTTATVDRVPSTDKQLDVLWEEEWRERALEIALDRLKRQASDRHFQIFYLNAVKGQPAGNVAKALGVTRGQVYLIRCRLLPKLRRLLRETND